MGALFISSALLTAHGQSLSYHLGKADSLFAQKRYTQSIDLYRSIHNQKQYTPAMFLKMAYIEEGLDRLAPALYYLNLYYVSSHDDRVVPKIKELADKNLLEGFEFSDRERALLLYGKYHLNLSVALAALALFLMSLVVALRYRKKKLLGAWIFLLIVLTLLLLHTNLPVQSNYAIVSTPNTYLMSGPSAGASVVQIINEGHRVSITGHKDVWVKIRWRDKDAYIKADNLLVVSL
ncbi:MAG: SH3 domain-containing protein [Cyclobacteriaceae bacterium]|nr:SH3 domain-containing protein [Cyclobacteriaceae bacterium]UYN86309.1 MAG: SH3 domain-containing protein [Cyclobacteriaceae bacterium]